MNASYCTSAMINVANTRSFNFGPIPNRIYGMQYVSISLNNISVIRSFNSKYISKLTLASFKYDCRVANVVWFKYFNYFK